MSTPRKAVYRFSNAVANRGSARKSSIQRPRSLPIISVNSRSTSIWPGKTACSSSEGEPARARYLTFLKAGSSRFPLDTLREAGVDFRTPRPVEEALKAFDGLVGEMETIWARLKK